MVQDTEARHTAVIVEDDLELRALAAALLEETDLRVVEASSAEEALHYFDRHSGEVAFLFAAVRPPFLMDGLDLARTIRLKWPWIRTVLTSDAPIGDNFDEALKQVCFMPKPWLPLEVLIEAEKAAEAKRFVHAMSGRPGTLANAPM